MAGMATAEYADPSFLLARGCAISGDCGFRMIGCQVGLQIIFSGKYDILFFFELYEEVWGTKKNLFFLPGAPIHENLTSRLGVSRIKGEGGKKNH